MAVARRTVARRTVARRTVARRTVGRRTVGRRTAVLLFPLAVLAAGLAACATPPAAPPGAVQPEPTPPADAAAARFDATAPGALNRAVAELLPRAGVLNIGPGRYVLQPTSYIDPTCGNCADPAESVPATVGVRISGRNLRIAGTDREQVVIETGAGYGLLFEDCENCVLSGVTVTGGTRDEDGRATSAGIVVRRSTLVIEDCVIRDNLGDSATVSRTVVGVAGIVGREGSDITVRNCEIRRNSWDGIALYRGARAHISDNVIDGVDRASGANMQGGRGVGIGMTWDARAVVERNLVTRYWKGIGVFVDADADVRENVVEDILTWGIALWGPADARPAARIEGNAVYRTGACGISLDRPAGGPPPGALRSNVVIRTGQDERYDGGEPYCWQRPVARHRVPPDFVEEANILFDNRQPLTAGSAPPPLPELLAERFFERAAPLTRRLAAHPALRGALLFRDLPELGR
jgi:hypothetical protein